MSVDSRVCPAAANKTKLAPMAEPSQAVAIAIQAGIDVSLIDDNLRLSPEDRLRQHQDALNLAMALERAGQELRERSAASASPAP